jgi:hypothetical protein
MDFMNTTNPIRMSRGARPSSGIGCEEDLVMSLALTMGLDRVTTGEQELAFELRLQDADPVRLAAIATVLRTPEVKGMVESRVPNFEQELVGVHRAALEAWAQKPSGHDRGKRLKFCQTLCSKDMAHLPQGWSLAHLWSRGTEFVRSLDQSEDRYCAGLMANYAVRKSMVTSLWAFVFGAGLALLAHQFQLV